VTQTGLRLQSLDVFRGLTIAAMLLVNNPGRWSDAYIYAPFRHAQWNGWTFTDLVFPFFLFIMGVAMVYSFVRRVEAGQSHRTLFAHAWRRSLVLILLGLFQNRFPFYPSVPDGIGSAAADAGWGGLLLRLGCIMVFVAILFILLEFQRNRWWLCLLGTGLLLGVLGHFLASAADSGWFWRYMGEARIPGVLFRIGLCYFLAAVILLTRPNPRVLLLITVVLLTTTAIWTLYAPLPGFGRPDLNIGLMLPDGGYIGIITNWCDFLDTHVVGIRCLHSLPESETGKLIWAFDPEGLGSTPAALATVLVGILCGMWLCRSQPLVPWVKLLGLILGGVCLILGGIVMNLWIPINKQLWTSSYTVFMSGLALVALAICFFLIEMRGWRQWSAPFVWYGRNAITAFFLSSLAARLMVHIRVLMTQTDGSEQMVTLKSWLFETIFAPWTAPKNASLMYALSVVVVWATICGLMYRRRIFLKI